MPAGKGGKALFGFSAMDKRDSSVGARTISDGRVASEAFDVPRLELFWLAGSHAPKCSASFRVTPKEYTSPWVVSRPSIFRSGGSHAQSALEVDAALIAFSEFAREKWRRTCKLKLQTLRKRGWSTDACTDTHDVQTKPHVHGEGLGTCGGRTASRHKTSDLATHAVCDKNVCRAQATVHDGRIHTVKELKFGAR